MQKWVAVGELVGIRRKTRRDEGDGRVLRGCESLGCDARLRLARRGKFLVLPACWMSSSELVAVGLSCSQRRTDLLNAPAIAISSPAPLTGSTSKASPRMEMSIILQSPALPWANGSIRHLSIPGVMITCTACLGQGAELFTSEVHQHYRSTVLQLESFQRVWEHCPSVSMPLLGGVI